MTFAARLAVRRLREAGLTVAVAESLTAGLVSARLAQVPGASAVLRGGVCAYATDAKVSVLGVDAALVERRGPVDEDVARGMARGVARLLGVDVAVATTGVAGPGPSDGHPAGTVWIAAGPAGALRTRRLRLAGTREDVREASAAAALTLLAEAVAAGPPRHDVAHRTPVRSDAREQPRATDD